MNAHLFASLLIAGGTKELDWKKITLLTNLPEVSLVNLAEIIVPIEANDKNIKVFGNERIQKINAMLPKVAEYFARVAEINGLKLEKAGVSDQSTKQEVVFCGICTEGARYYLNESDFSILKNGLK